MSRHPSRLAPQVDALETRLALAAVTAAATAEATLTPAEYQATRRDIQRTLVVLARTDDEVRAAASLERAVRRVPGAAQLLPRLQDDLATVDPADRGSALLARRRMALDLDDFIRGGVADGTITVRGGLRNRFQAPAAAASYSFVAQNQTQLNLNFLITQGNATLNNTTVFAQRSPTLFYTTLTAAPVTATVSATNNSVPPYAFTLPGNATRVQVTLNVSGGLNVTYYPS